MSYCLGLTGSIGMGKTTTAAMFAAQGVPVWDADQTVHLLYQGAAIEPMRAAFPESIKDGVVSRDNLRAMIAANPAILDRIQSIVHPLIAADRAQFITKATAPIILLDLPLLFEIGAEQLCDGVVVVTAPADLQRARVLARGQMTAEQFDIILSRQIPDAEKRARADWVIEMTNLADATAQVAQILAEIKESLNA
jgi:dephospho-CoA kinase